MSDSENSKGTILFIHHEFDNLYVNKESGLFIEHYASKNYDIRFIVPNNHYEEANENWSPQFKLLPLKKDYLDWDQIRDLIDSLKEKLKCVWIYMNSGIYKKMIPYITEKNIQSVVHMDAYAINTRKFIFPFHSTSKTMAKASVVLCQSPRMIKNFLSPKVKKKCVLYPNSFNGAKIKFKKEDVTKEKVLLYSGRLFHQKGADLLLEAFMRICSKIPEWRLEFVGTFTDQKYVNQLKDKVNTNEMNERVHIQPALSGEAYYKKIASASIMVVPSREEGQTNVLMEAMHLNTAVIASSGCLVHYLLNNGECGLIYDVNHAQALDEALLEMINNENKRLKFIKTARERQNELFDFEKNFSELTKRLEL